MRQSEILDVNDSRTTDLQVLMNTNANVKVQDCPLNEYIESILQDTEKNHLTKRNRKQTD